MDGNKEHEMPEADDLESLDLYLNAEVLLPLHGEHMQAATVIGCSKDVDGNQIGEYHTNPLLNTIVYDVQFPDGFSK